MNISPNLPMPLTVTLCCDFVPVGLIGRVLLNWLRIFVGRGIPKGARMDTNPIETDYLVVGAGATAMAFVDTLLSKSDSQVVMVDRHHRPGGHWNHAYSYVGLHQPPPSTA